MSSADSNLTVSLELHLSQVLNPLPEILPPELGSRLSSELLRPEIHYALLSDISKWSRSEAGRAALMHHNLQASSYSMISLLAGSVTSPFSRPPPHVRPESARHVAGRELNDKKAITAILNALLSVVGSGAATWWAANQSGWRDEWKVLLSFIVAVVVAVSETILYIIWQSRKSAPKQRPVNAARTLKKQDGEGDVIVDAGVSDGDGDAGGLRRRTIATNVTE